MVRTTIIIMIRVRSTQSAHEYRIPLVYTETIAELEAAGYTHVSSHSP